jgi:hypothetical protein
MRSIFSFLTSIALLVGVTLSSCGGEDAGGQGAANEQKSASNGGPQGASILKVGDKLFNLPSPLETAMLIEEVGGHFNEGMLNANVDATKYSVKFLQAMNLGVYGADLGYCLIYNQSQKAFTLLATCKKLGTELGISPALYTGLMKRFEGNMENKDSLLIFVSELNRLSDEYLKENESEDISAMILYGGWVESLYFVTELSKSLKNDKLRARVGEQKNTLENLIGLITQQNGDGRFDSMLEDLEDLKSSFAKVNSSYTWVEPETRPEEKLTIIKSKSSVQLDDALLQEISQKISALRNNIISTTAS